MPSYRFSYRLQSSFVPQVDWHFFKLRVIPQPNDFQQVQLLNLEIMPKCHLSDSYDGFGNKIQWGSIDYIHGGLTVISEGMVTQHAPYVIKGEPEPYYLAETPLTTCDESMRTKASQLGTPEAIMHYVHNHICYVPNSTTVSTTAHDVYINRQGVCQDYAHLMIAMCRSVGIHARYANGFIIGEGQTHAWVEISDGEQWKAYDPTHDINVEWDYIKIAHGRDTNDCPTNRGRMYSYTCEYMTVSCKLTKQ